VTPEAQLLTTIPGISVFGALLIVSQIGDIIGFPPVTTCARMPTWCRRFIRPVGKPNTVG